MTINASSQESASGFTNVPRREKVLIIGCGDIGERLAAHLNPKQYQVMGLRRRPPADLPYLKYTAGDATDPEQLDAILSGDDFAVIVISMTPAERSDAGYERAYVNTCRHLVAGLVHHQRRPRLVIFVSSTGVYGQTDGSWVDESSPTTADSFSGIRLLEAEQVIQLSGFTHSIVRFSGIYGPGRNRLIEQVIQKRASASPHYTNRIHADDCAGFIAHLINLQSSQTLAPVYLATDSAPTPMVEVVSWIANQLAITDFLSATAVNERGNKRIRNRTMLETGYKLRYPDFRAGYSQLIKSRP